MFRMTTDFDAIGMFGDSVVTAAEDHILDNLGPRDLVSAKQVCKRWSAAVRRYIRHLDAQKKSELMGEAFLEPVEIYATVKVPHPVRDLAFKEDGQGGWQFNKMFLPQRFPQIKIALIFPTFPKNGKNLV